MSADEESLVQRVREVVAKVLGVEPSAVVLGARIDQVAQIDSLSLAEIASALDDAFAIRIPTAGMMEAQTVGDLAALVQGLVAARNGPA